MPLSEHMWRSKRHGVTHLGEMSVPACLLAGRGEFPVSDPAIGGGVCGALAPERMSLRMGQKFRSESEKVIFQ